MCRALSVACWLLGVGYCLPCVGLRLFFMLVVGHMLVFVGCLLSVVVCCLFDAFSALLLACLYSLLSVCVFVVVCLLCVFCCCRLLGVCCLLLLFFTDCWCWWLVFVAVLVLDGLVVVFRCLAVR